MTTRDTWGTWRVVVGGVDVTNFRSAPVEIQSYQLEEPYGCGPASIVVPKVTPYEQPGTGDLAWLKPGQAVDFYQRRPDTTINPVPYWSGEVSGKAGSVTETERTLTIGLIGDLYPASLQIVRIPVNPAPKDIGTLLPDMLNSVVHRRVGAIPHVTTGITSSRRAGFDPNILSAVSAELGEATTDDGTNQWTIARKAGVARSYVMRLKDISTITATVQAGQRGISVNLDWDQVDGVNAIYGHGVSLKGEAWAGWEYPNLHADTTTPYPFSSSSSVIDIGTTDGDTTSGSGVSDWQQRVQDLGWNINVDGVYSSSDASVCRSVQRHFGITVDGVVGPQTWNATFGTGSNAGTLDGALRLPLWHDPKVAPVLYNADGSVVGNNPADDPSILRVEIDVNYGDGRTKQEAVRSATAFGRRNEDPGLTGTVTLRMDPQGAHKYDIREGGNIELKNYGGVTKVLHIGGVTVRPRDESVDLQVSENFHDLMTIAAVMDRDDASRADAARRPGPATTPSKPNAFDSESGAGVIPKSSLFAGLWTVERIPVSFYGGIAKAYFQTFTPITKFCVALFGKSITANELISLVGNGGNPLSNRNDGFGPFDKNLETLQNDFALIQAWGGPGQAAGYWPGFETSPHVTTSAVSTPVTGKMLDDAGWDFVSATPPFVWVAMWAPVSTHIKGRLTPKPVDL